jgi:hypothetical protein
MCPELLYVLFGVAAVAGPVQPQPAATASETAPAVAPLFPTADAAPPAPVVQAGSFHQRSAGPACLPCPPYTYPYGSMPPGTMPIPGTTAPGTMPPNVDPNAQQNPVSNLQNPFAQAAEAGGEGAQTYNQNFFGDIVGVFASVRPVGGGVTTTPGQIIGQRVVLQNGQIVTTQVVGPGQTVVGPVTKLPLTGQYGGIQLVENDNPRPTDRFYFGYNYYDRVGASLNPGGQFVNVNRETIGFEKTFLRGDASIGLRLPFNQVNGADIRGRQVGDLTILTKFVITGDRQTGDLLSTGFILTTPTGGSPFGVPVVLADGSPVPHTWLFQPWVGFIKNYDRMYVQGVTNVVVPATNETVTFLGNTLGAGYWMYRNPEGRYLTGIVPIAEVNVRTPLNHRDPNGLIYMQDMVNVNAGVHFRTPRAVFSGGVSVPTVGPRPWGIEAIAYMNYLF